MTAARLHHVPVMLVRRGMHYVTDDGVTFDALGPEELLLAPTARTTSTKTRSSCD
jgi:hypothetical protein